MGIVANEWNGALLLGGSLWVVAVRLFQKCQEFGWSVVEPGAKGWRSCLLDRYPRV